MTDMLHKAQEFELSLLTKVASSAVVDQLKLRRIIEKSLYQCSKASFKTLNSSQKSFKAKTEIKK